MLTDAEPVDQYLRTFSWNKVKYRADKSLGELMDLLQKVINQSTDWITYDDGY